MKIKNKIYFMLILLFIAITCLSCGIKESELYIFDDIDECNAIELYFDNNSEIERYDDSPENDEYYEDYSYTEFYGVKIISDESEIEFFAYCFENSEECQNYYHAVTGKNRDGEKAYTYWGNFEKCNVIVIDNNRAYLIKSDSQSFEQIMEMLSNCFSVYMGKIRFK